MTTYKVSNLTQKTPQDQQTKLENALMGVVGIDRVGLHPDRSEVSLSFSSRKEPNREVIEKALNSSGFKLAAQR